MQECLIRSLSIRRREIHRRWEVLLRLERPETPLANPDALVHMIDWTLDTVFDDLRGRMVYRGGDSPPQRHGIARPLPLRAQPIL
jgi:hypothetical protein